MNIFSKFDGLNNLPVYNPWMNFIFTIYSALFLVVSMISFFGAFLAWQRRSVNCAKELALLMIASGFWAFWIIFETASQSVDLKIFWSKLEYFGAVSAPVLYFIFVLRFTGKGRFISTKNILLLFIIPVVTLLFALTNGQHYLIWSGFSSISEKTNIMEYYHGIWFWIGYLAYNYILFILSTYFLFYFIFYQKKVFRAQGFIIFFAGLCPWIASIFYLFGISPVSGIDLPPISIILSGSLFAFAILSTPFLDLVPVARERLVEVLPEGILVLDGQNRIIDINESALSFLGIRNKNIIGIRAESSDASVLLLLNAVLDHETIKEIDIKNNDEISTYRITKQTILSHPNSRLVVIHNITERKLLELKISNQNQELSKLNSDKDRFMSIIAHDLKSPFCSLLGFSELLSENIHKYDFTDIESSAKSIHKSAQTIFNLLEDILLWAKSKSGKIAYEPEEVNFNQICLKVLEILSPVAIAKDISINCPSSFELKIFADVNMLKTILRNLVSNAIKFTNPGGQISIYAEQSGSDVTVVVSDNGTGMGPEALARLFDISQATSTAGTANETGTGLGLFLCKDYVEKHKGKIWVNSEPDKGTTFCFSLPEKK
jgi:signal transduction histidine kinase